MKSTTWLGAVGIGTMVILHANPTIRGGPPPTYVEMNDIVTTPAPKPSSVVFPLKVSTNHRYLVDQDGVPFMIVGDSPQALIGNVPLEEAKKYIENRARFGINALWINLICNRGTACNASGATYDGVAPFTTAGDLSTPNPDYFARADAVIRQAAASGMAVFLDPIETAGWLPVLRSNGMAKARAYGEYLGNRYKGFANIVWMHGNDFQSWQSAQDDALVQAVAKGIRSADHAHLHTVELNYLSSGSQDDPTWTPLIDLSAAYTYFSTYAQVLAEYNRPTVMPVFMVEANYEFEKNPGTDGGSLTNMRHQEYWTMLSGATGQLYGSAFTWPFPSGWQQKLDTPGVQQLSYMKAVFETRRWYDLVPDQDHTVVTAGYGTFSKTWRISADTYVTAARTMDGTLLMAYLPTRRPVTVDMSRLSDRATACWYDPTNGTYRSAIPVSQEDSPKQDFTPPGKNAAGDDDWVLIVGTSAC